MKPLRWNLTGITEIPEIILRSQTSVPGVDVAVVCGKRRQWVTSRAHRRCGTEGVGSRGGVR